MLSKTDIALLRPAASDMVDTAIGERRADSLFTSPHSENPHRSGVSAIPTLPVSASMHWFLLVLLAVEDDNPCESPVANRRLKEEVDDEPGGVDVLNALWDYLGEIKPMTPEMRKVVE